MSALPRTQYTPEEYLAFERQAQYKSEYLDGEIVAMSGASRAHNLITVNLARVLGNQFVERPCEVYTSDMRVRVNPRTYAYPDVVAVCGEPDFEDEELDTLTNPTVLMEVLSPSTESYDRGKKSARFRKIPSLQEYLLIAQDRPFIEHYIKRNDTWFISDVSELDAALELSSINCRLTLQDIYSKVKFPEDQFEPNE
jgi:Uma2 family endonuclease